MALQPGCTAKEPRYNGNIQSEVRLSAVLTRSRLEAHLTTFVDGYINVDLVADTIQEPKVRFTNHDMAPMIIPVHRQGASHVRIVSGAPQNHLA